MSESFDRNYLSLLNDSIVLLEMAQTRENILQEETLARASAVSSMLIPEVVANICIESLSLENSIYHEIDKLSTIGKFDYYLRVKHRGRKIDRGQRPIQELQELKKIRDMYVHPKKAKVTWTNYDDDSADGESEKTDLLKITKNMNMWYVEDAKIIMSSTHSFLCYFFKDLCKYSSKRVANLIFSVVEIPGEEGGAIPLMYESTKTLLKQWSVDISYVGVYCTRIRKRRTKFST
jgi:hypothetical protein